MALDGPRINESNRESQSCYTIKSRLLPSQSEVKTYFFYHNRFDIFSSYFEFRQFVIEIWIYKVNRLGPAILKVLRDLGSIFRHELIGVSLPAQF